MLALGLSLNLSAQVFNQNFPRAEKPELWSFKPVIFEGLICYNEDKNSITLYIIYRLEPKFLTFVKNEETQQEVYIAKAEIIVEVFDDKGTSLARQFNPVYVESNQPNSEIQPYTNEVQGFFSFKLPPANYSMTLEVKDLATNNIFIDRNINLQLPAFKDKILKSSSIFYVHSADQKLEEKIKGFKLTNYGGNVIIGQKTDCLLQLILDTNNISGFSWKIKQRVFESDKEYTTILSDSNFSIIDGIPSIKKINRQLYIHILDSSNLSKVLRIPIPFERLETGKYELEFTLSIDTMKMNFQETFEVIWPNQPRSLSNMNLAIDALHHIATEKEMLEMKSMNQAKSRQAFKEFWKKRSPDTLCAYNPVMAEYYRRVDEAIRRFSTKDEQNGYKTDRGRILILFGSPTKINRILKPDFPPKEIWTYEKLQQRFIFIDNERTGNYVLIREEKY